MVRFLQHRSGHRQSLIWVAAAAIAILPLAGTDTVSGAAAEDADAARCAARE